MQLAATLLLAWVLLSVPVALLLGAAMRTASGGRGGHGRRVDIDLVRIERSGALAGR